jgi:hypothetical protein
VLQLARWRCGGGQCWLWAVLPVGGVGGVAVGGVAVREVAFGGIRVTGSEAIGVGVVVCC